MVARGQHGSIWRSYGKKGTDGVLDPTTWGNAKSRVKVGTGYPVSLYPAAGSVGDVTGDGRADLWARKADNTMLGWPGKTRGTDNMSFGSSFVIDGITGGSRIPAGTTLAGGQSLTSRSAKLTMQPPGRPRPPMTTPYTPRTRGPPRLTHPEAAGPRPPAAP
ncbi:hypothetical protein ACIQ7Q_25820 [Streptomyces sp. NPDC096176]|uniref:hypothetical protein n=1 Tax=Streptomyces sp. NPDC096176 TaxID=3366079 RepID=UPI00381C9EE2